NRIRENLAQRLDQLLLLCSVHLRLRTGSLRIFSPERKDRLHIDFCRDWCAGTLPLGGAPPPPRGSAKSLSHALTRPPKLSPRPTDPSPPPCPPGPSSSLSSPS